MFSLLGKSANYKTAFEFTPFFMYMEYNARVYTFYLYRIVPFVNCPILADTQECYIFI